MNSPPSAGLFNTDHLTDEEVQRQLKNRPSSEPPPTLPVTTLPSSEYPSDQGVLFDLTTQDDYEKLPPEWKEKFLYKWEDDLRYIPQDIAISSLFTIGNNKTPRKAYQRELIPILNKNFELRFTGIELRQDDEKIWMQCLHINRGYAQPLGAPVYFEASQFIRSIGLSVSQANYTHLKESFARLQATTIELYSKKAKITRTFRLVCHFQFEDENHYPLPAWKVVLDPRLFYLLDKRYHTRLHFERSKRLGNGLASKLHSYYASHAVPMERSVNDLFRLCVGDDEALMIAYTKGGKKKLTSDPAALEAAEKYLMNRKRDFRHKLKGALDRLVKPPICFLESFTISERNKEYFIKVIRTVDNFSPDPDTPLPDTR